MTSEIPLKTGVNTRAPLESRLPKKQPELQAPGSYALHHSLETTYDIDYTAMPLEKLVDKSNRFSVASITSGGRLSAASHHSTGSDAAGDTGMRTLHRASMFAAGRERHSADGYRERVVTVDELHQDPNGGRTTDGDSAPSLTGFSTDQSDSGAKLKAWGKPIAYPSNQWESESHAATRNVQPEQRLDFYSAVRKIEKVDDDQRGGLVGSVQRGVEIRTKRACDPVMKPFVGEYAMADAVEMPLVAAQEKRLVRRNYLDLVECEHLNPNGEYNYGFHEAPATRLPGEDLAQTLDVQSKAITHMGTSHDMFRGYPKFLDDKIVGYAGHIPQNDRNVAAIHHGLDPRREYSRSHMTLAVHGGGIDAAITTGNIRARHRSGKSAPAPKMLKPKTDDLIAQTMEGYMLQVPLFRTLERERAMNLRDDAQAKKYF